MDPVPSEVSEGNGGGWEEGYRFEQSRRMEQEKIRL